MFILPEIQTILNLPKNQTKYWILVNDKHVKAYRDECLFWNLLWNAYKIKMDWWVDRWRLKSLEQAVNSSRT